MNVNYVIRKAERQDVPLLLEFIMGIARYEKMENEVIASPEVLEREMFDVLMECADGSLIEFHFHHHQVLIVAHDLADDAITGIFPLDVGGNLVGIAFLFHNQNLMVKCNAYLPRLRVRREASGGKSKFRGN